MTDDVYELQSDSLKDVMTSSSSSSSVIENDQSEKENKEKVEERRTVNISLRRQNITMISLCISKRFNLASLSVSQNEGEFNCT